MVSPCAHTSEPSRGLSGASLTAELTAAERRCEAASERLTAPRRRALELLLTAGQPVKAYELLSAFRAGGGDPAKPPTVYRALEFLERQGFAHRIESLNAYVACRCGARAHPTAFLICDCCGATAEVEQPAEPLAGALGAASGYALSSLSIEAHGLCAACRG
ncbi:MAG: Fur family transcriptional regulator [Caulobacteraceae bacterium]|nr:Fur family transcriptional regulator [Caulobacteraceae bacterium]